MVDPGVHLVEVALRDSRNLDVILAMNRLVPMPDPSDKAAVRQTVEDMKQVKDFVESRVPDELYESAVAIFIEHKDELMRHVTEGEG